jgi:hypothetical protein
MVVSRITVVWEVISCGLVNAYGSFRGTYCLKAIAKVDGFTLQRT